MTREECLSLRDPSFTDLREAGVILQEWLQRQREIKQTREAIN